ncbi:hypothetical protein R3P38DRAFT_2824378 [Favolaschia claudopus]|uniref:Uncharacterized protein n=1 Tax=Favolaschia claudopus TaxID=2862362 RepID=A0AAW0EJL0_9AGAR
MRAYFKQVTRPFSHSAPSRARRTAQEIRQQRKAETESIEPPTREELQKILKRESERVFGPTNIGDPKAYVNKVADDVWKNILQASNNDPKVFNTWRDDIKSRAASDIGANSKATPRTASDPLGMRASSTSRLGTPPSKATTSSSKGAKPRFPPK